MTLLSTIDGRLLKEMILSGILLLEKNKSGIDALNVFPVPDGDTGTNMSLTMMSAAKELQGVDSASASDVALAVSRGSLRGARGNSGVILSQLYRGFALALEGIAHIDTRAFAAALKAGSEAAYKAVMKPKEGTMLTVAKEIADKAVEYAAHGGDLYGLLEKMLTWGEDVLKRTPDMLPVLKQAGVVDAGGKGLLLIYMGYKMYIDGDTVEDIDAALGLDSALPSLPSREADTEEIEFGYCTEFLLHNIRSGVGEEYVDRFRDRLSRIGDSVIVVADEGLVKVHVHTNDPGKVLQYALTIGELINIKIDNMRQQHQHLHTEDALVAEAVAAELTIDRNYGIVSVCAGAGVAALMSDLGAQEIVEGGQTMNPSTEDLLNAARRTRARDVYMLPNNKNIVLAAQQAAELSGTQRIHVVPTNTIPQGIAALVPFMPDSSVSDNLFRMNEAAEAVLSGSVTYAVRDSKINGRRIRQGEIMGMNGGEIKAVGKDIEQVTLSLLEEMQASRAEMITLIHGEEVSAEQANSLVEKLRATTPEIDIEIVDGGQPLYYYLISIE